MHNDAIGYIPSPGFPNTYGRSLTCTYSVERSGQDSVTLIFPVFYLHDRYSGYHYACSDEQDWVEVS